jgi:hypothetical protein
MKATMFNWTLVSFGKEWLFDLFWNLMLWLMDLLAHELLHLFVFEDKSSPLTWLVAWVITVQLNLYEKKIMRAADKRVKGPTSQLMIRVCWANFFLINIFNLIYEKRIKKKNPYQIQGPEILPRKAYVNSWKLFCCK